MKKLTVLSMIAAALLLTACGDSSTGAEAKAATEAATETKTEAPMKCGEGKCGDAMKKEAAEKTEAAAAKTEEVAAEAKTAATEAKEAVSNAAEKVKEAASETVSNAATAVKDTAAGAAEKVKEAAGAVAATATGAVAAVTGPDGKALYAKCAGCHGADGKTKAMGKAAPVAGQSAADLETKLAGYKAGTLNSVGMGMLMKGQVASMSDEDIKAVAAYMAGL